MSFFHFWSDEVTLHLHLRHICWSAGVQKHDFFYRPKARQITWRRLRSVPLWEAGGSRWEYIAPELLLWAIWSFCIYVEALSIILISPAKQTHFSLRCGVSSWTRGGLSRETKTFDLLVDLRCSPRPRSPQPESDCRNTVSIQMTRLRGVPRSSKAGGLGCFLSAFPLEDFQARWTGRRPWRRPRTHARDYKSHLARDPA